MIWFINLSYDFMVTRSKKTLEKAYNVKIETGYMSSKGTVYILHEENLMLLFETIKELQQYLEEVYS